MSPAEFEAMKAAVMKLSRESELQNKKLDRVATAFERLCNFVDLALKKLPK